MKKITTLRWLFLGVLLAVLPMVVGGYVVYKLPTQQLRLFAEPDYLALFSHAIAEKINNDAPQAVGVFKDQELAGCNEQRVSVQLTAPFGLPTGNYDLNFDNPLVSEIRYSNRLQSLCTLNGMELRPKSVVSNGKVIPDKLPIISQAITFPNTVEYTVGDFHTDLVHQIQSTAQWPLSGIDLRSLAFQDGGKAEQELVNRFPVMGVSGVRQIYHQVVLKYYQDKAAILLRMIGIYSVSISIFCLIALVSMYFWSTTFARNEDAISLAGFLGGSAPRAVILAGKVSFWRFVFGWDLRSYLDGVWMRQREVLVITQEWVETQAAIKKAKNSTPALSSSEKNAGSQQTQPSGRRTLKLRRYQGREQEPNTVEAIARKAVQVATKVVQAEQSLKGFALPPDMLPTELPALVVLAITEILRTLLAGSRGLACFGQHRTNEDSLRRSIYNRSNILRASPRSYERALTWLLAEGVVNFLNESTVKSYSITMGNKDITDLGIAIRNFLSSENRRRRGGH